jgi:hypothetical protein
MKDPRTPFRTTGSTLSTTNASYWTSQPIDRLLTDEPDLALAVRDGTDGTD